MLRSVLAVVGGLVLAFALVFATDALFHSLIATAPKPDAGDAEAMRTYVARQPAEALIAIVAGWALAAFAGAALAVRLGRRGRGPGWVVTALFLIATASNFLLVPHPGWMIIAAFVLILAAGWLGSSLVGRLDASDASRRPAG